MRPHLDLTAHLTVHVAARLRALSRTVHPLTGALANAHDAVRDDSACRAQRRVAALQQAAALGPAAWVELDRPHAPEGHRPRHALDLYADDAALVGRLTAYVADGLAGGEVCVVIATAEHRAGLRTRLHLTDLDRAVDDGRLVELDAEQVLSRFLRDDWPDPELFDRSVAEVVRSVAAGGTSVRAFGEMVGLLHLRGLPGAAHQLEKLWDSLQRELGFALVCAYPLSGDDEQDDGLRALAGSSHTHLVAAVS